ncbi:MAG: hypothetical protein AAGA85_17015 [Bacteroidota bacterium]
MRIQLSITLAAFICTISLAQNMEYSAYLTTSLSLWERAVAEKQAHFDQNSSIENRYQLALTQFGLVNATMKDQEEKTFNKYADDLEDHLDYLIDEGYQAANAKALLSGLYGFKIGHSSWKGMFLGSKASSLATAALSEDPESPIVRKMYANNKLFTPEVWGGDVSEAIKSYERSQELFEAQDTDTFNWMYLDNFAWLGQAYQQKENYAAAEATYKKALEVEQGFSWIKYGLLPALAQND